MTRGADGSSEARIAFEYYQRVRDVYLNGVEELDALARRPNRLRRLGRKSQDPRKLAAQQAGVVSGMARTIEASQPPDELGAAHHRLVSAIKPWAEAYAAGMSEFAARGEPNWSLKPRIDELASAVRSALEHWEDDVRFVVERWQA